jgi:hypothetical protein
MPCRLFSWPAGGFVHIKIKFPRFAKRLLGLIFLLVGLWLFKGFYCGFMDIYASAQGSRDIKALLVLGVVDIMLIAAGAALLYNPDILDE